MYVYMQPSWRFSDSCNGTACVCVQIMESLCQWMTLSSSWWQPLWRSVDYLLIQHVSWEWELENDHNAKMVSACMCACMLVRERVQECTVPVWACVCGSLAVVCEDRVHVHVCVCVPMESGICGRSNYHTASSWPVWLKRDHTVQCNWRLCSCLRYE